jgi:acetoin utilization protein AcuB
VLAVLVEEWMTRQPHCVKPLDSIRHAREIMEQHRINQLPVVVDDRLVGIVTDRDLRDAFPSVFDEPRRGEPYRREPNGGQPRRVEPAAIRVETVMTPYVVTVGPKDSVADAARLMRRERVGAIPIVEANRLVGIITRSDILDAFVALAQVRT